MYQSFARFHAKPAIYDAKTGKVKRARPRPPMSVYDPARKQCVIVTRAGRPAPDESRAVQNATRALHRKVKRFLRQCQHAEHKAQVQVRFVEGQERARASAARRKKHEDQEALWLAAEHGAPGMSRVEVRNILREIAGLPAVEDSIGRSARLRAESSAAKRHHVHERARQAYHQEVEDKRIATEQRKAARALLHNRLD